jgi:SAM-dependent methyltransferase
MAVPAVANYVARWGYRTLDARRYEKRRYGGFARRLNLRLLERAIGRAVAGLPPGALVLNVACGTGIVGRALAANGLRVVGLDISPAMLALAAERGEAVGHVRADLELPPVRAQSVDAVLCARFLMLVPSAARPRLLARLAELARGPVIATVCHPYTTKSLTRRLRRALGWRGVKSSARLDRRALEAEAAAAGLRVERVIPVLPLFSEVWVVVFGRAAAT